MLFKVLLAYCRNPPLFGSPRNVRASLIWRLAQTRDGRRIERQRALLGKLDAELRQRGDGAARSAGKLIICVSACCISSTVLSPTSAPPFWPMFFCTSAKAAL